jgi:putative ABC transport system ATP-binding protein
MTNTNKALLELDKVQLTLKGGGGPVDILRQVSFSALPGEIIAVVGPSGSGKTTMLMVAAGLEKPSFGSVRMDGHELTDMDEDQLAVHRREHIGIVFQGFHLAPAMTAVENVALPLEFAGRSDALERAAEALEKVGLSQRAHHYPAQMSGGEQQRTALARAFVAEPRILLADEPTGNLDAETGALVMDRLFAMTEERGAGLLLVTHDEKLAARCSRRLVMKDGTLSEAQA